MFLPASRRHLTLTDSLAGISKSGKTTYLGKDSAGLTSRAGHLQPYVSLQRSRYLFDLGRGYAASAQLGYEAGRAEITQMPPSSCDGKQCLRCHMVGFERKRIREPLTAIPDCHFYKPQHPAACHGIARHMNSSGKAAIVNPALWIPLTAYSFHHLSLLEGIFR